MKPNWDRIDARLAHQIFSWNFDVILMDRGKPVYPLPLPVEWGYNKAPMTYDHAWFCY
jgi:hypothetical protein